MTKWVYNFGKLGTDGESSMRNLLGGKGANLAEMSGIGLPVPPGFTISTDVCTYFYDHNHTYPDTLDAEVRAAIAKIEAETGSAFADPKNPIACVCAVWGAGVDARHDGYSFESGLE